MTKTDQPNKTENKTWENIHLALMHAQNDIRGKISDDGSMAGKYRYKTIDSIVSAAQLALFKNGIAFSWSMTEDAILESFETQKGAIAYHAKVQATLTFTNVSTQESINIVQFADAIDYSDKAIVKASRFALKYGLINVLLIATGQEEDDPDSEVNNKHIEENSNVSKKSSRSQPISKQDQLTIEKTKMITELSPLFGGDRHATKNAIAALANNDETFASMLTEPEDIFEKALPYFKNLNNGEA